MTRPQVMRSHHRGVSTSSSMSCFYNSNFSAFCQSNDGGGNQPPQPCQEQDIWNLHSLYLWLLCIGRTTGTISHSPPVRHLSLPDELHLAGSSQTKCPPRFTPIYIISVAATLGEICCFGIFNHQRGFGGREMTNPFFFLSFLFPFPYFNSWICLGEFWGRGERDQNNI